MNRDIIKPETLQNLKDVNYYTRERFYLPELVMFIFAEIPLEIVRIHLISPYL